MRIKKVCGRIKLVDFDDTKGFLEKMPVYLISDHRSVYGFLLIFEICIIYFFYLVYFSGEKNVVEGIIYLVVISLLVALCFIYRLKKGAFILSANENGIFYKTVGKPKQFGLLEWIYISEIKYSFYDGDCFLDIIFKEESHKVPVPCNAEVSGVKHSKYSKITFMLLNVEKYVDKYDLKTELDNLRVKFGKAKFF